MEQSAEMHASLPPAMITVDDLSWGCALGTGVFYASVVFFTSSPLSVTKPPDYMQAGILSVLSLVIVGIEVAEVTVILPEVLDRMRNKKTKATLYLVFVLIVCAAFLLPSPSPFAPLVVPVSSFLALSSILTFLALSHSRRANK